MAELVFDFRNVSYEQGRQSFALQSRARAIERQINKSDDIDEVDRLLEQHNQCMSSLDAITFASVKTVPRDWLIEAAPEGDIDWTNPGNWRYLRVDKKLQLELAMTKKLYETDEGN